MAPKPLAAKPAGTIPKLSASKVYVLPPRPKPGRKPSADVPPNKRKAQNRAAQRAFRERKAQQVSDLEVRLQQLEESFRAREVNLNLTIRQLQKDKEGLQDQLRNTHLQLAKANSGYQVASPAPSVHDGDYDGAMTPEPMLSSASNGDGCGICVKDDCICEQVGLRDRRPSSSSATSSSLNRVSTPPPSTGSGGNDYAMRRDSVDSAGLSPLSHPLKRKFEEPARVATPPPPPAPAAATAAAPAPERRTSETEIDFTAMFARPSKSARKESPLKMVSVPRDRCGFCADGTPCMCAENDAFSEDNTLPPLILSPDLNKKGPKDKLPTLLPSVESAAAAGPPEGECSGDPGSCTLCQKDPMSTLFCTSLASRPASTPSNGTFIPASAAYQTLSRHQGFRRADFGSIIGKLQSRGTYVEVNSVANVLRELDRKFHQ